MVEGIRKPTIPFRIRRPFAPSWDNTAASSRARGRTTRRSVITVLSASYSEQPIPASPVAVSSSSSCHYHHRNRLREESRAGFKLRDCVRRFHDKPQPLEELYADRPTGDSKHPALPSPIQAHCSALEIPNRPEPGESRYASPATEIRCAKKTTGLGIDRNPMKNGYCIRLEQANVTTSFRP